MINELNKERELIQQKKQEIYKDILQKIYQKIKIANKLNNYCYYVIPKFMIGMPLINISKCSDFIYNQLLINGFKVTRIHYNYFLIYWGHTSTEQQTSIQYNTIETKPFHPDRFINV